MAAVLGILSLGISAQAQIPRINTFYPVGGKAGTTVTVEVRGSSLDGGGVVLVNAPGVTGQLVPGGGKEVTTPFGRSGRPSAAPATNSAPPATAA